MSGILYFTMEIEQQHYTQFLKNGPLHMILLNSFNDMLAHAYLGTKSCKRNETEW